MRKEVLENKILNETFLVCAKIIANQLIHKNGENEINELLKEISSLIISDYFRKAIDLIECAYDAQYIDIVLEYEYQKIDKSIINTEELKVLVILNKSITRLLQKNDIDLFYNLYSQECSAVVRDTLSVILNCE